MNNNKTNNKKAEVLGVIHLSKFVENKGGGLVLKGYIEADYLSAFAGETENGVRWVPFSLSQEYAESGDKVYLGYPREDRKCVKSWNKFGLDARNKLAAATHKLLSELDLSWTEGKYKRDYQIVKTGKKAVLRAITKEGEAVEDSVDCPFGM
jgi:hypothetical protein